MTEGNPLESGWGRRSMSSPMCVERADIEGPDILRQASGTAQNMISSLHCSKLKAPTAVEEAPSSMIREASLSVNLQRTSDVAIQHAAPMRNPNQSEAAGRHYRPNIDGLRAIAGAGGVRACSPLPCMNNGRGEGKEGKKSSASVRRTVRVLTRGSPLGPGQVQAAPPPVVQSE